MDVYDRAKIGKKVGRGGDRNVFMYGSNEVIKISSVSWLTGDKLHNKLIHDYLVCHRYFKEYMVKTRDVSLEDGKTHIEIQPFVSGEFIEKKHMNNPAVKSQLAEIACILNQMKSDKYAPLDLVGHMGMIRPCLSNVFLDDDNKLRIIDTTLLEAKTLMPIGLLIEILLPIVKVRQKYLPKKFLR